LGITIFNILIFALFTTQVHKLSQYQHQIWKKNTQIAQLKKEQKKVEPALHKSYQIASELSRLKTERARIVNTWRAIQRKGGRLGIASNRGAMIRTRGYDIKEITPDNEETTSLTQLNNNLNQIEKFIEQESNSQDVLLKDLCSYEVKLNHMPSKNLFLKNG
jgi:septal ring factor EnvC (AmiA/AmiB activator)